jgi:hypothetical protein
VASRESAPIDRHMTSPQNLDSPASFYGPAINKVRGLSSRTPTVDGYSLICAPVVMKATTVAASRRGQPS